MKKEKVWSDKELKGKDDQEEQEMHEDVPVATEDTWTCSSAKYIKVIETTCQIKVDKLELLDMVSYECHGGVRKDVTSALAEVSPRIFRHLLRCYLLEKCRWSRQTGSL